MMHIVGNIAGFVAGYCGVALVLYAALLCAITLVERARRSPQRKRLVRSEVVRSSFSVSVLVGASCALLWFAYSRHLSASLWVAIVSTPVLGFVALEAVLVILTGTYLPYVDTPGERE